MASQTGCNQAFVTLATNDTYALGALVWAHSLRRAATSRHVAIMISAGVSSGMRQQLAAVFDLVTEVNVLDSRDTSNLALLTRPDLGVTFTKLHCWRLTQYSKCVFMDADTMVLDNIDELFDREELSAAPDAGWPDCFNSGVFVFRPSEETYQALLQFAVTQGSFDGGDQGLLNLFFSDWATKDIARHLPFIYNVVSQAFYSYLPAFKQFGKNVKVVHFIGSTKPWHHSYNTSSHQVEPSTDTLHSMDYLQKWWSLFMDTVQPDLDPSVVSLVKIFEYLPHQVEKPPPPPPPKTLPFEEPDYKITSQYTPPEVPIFYEPTTGSEHRTEPFENRDNRGYVFYESFYTEPPMTYGEQYPATQHAYQANHFQETLNEMMRPVQSEKESATAATEDLEDTTCRVHSMCSGSDSGCDEGNQPVNRVDQSAASDVIELNNPEAGADGIVEHEHVGGDVVVEMVEKMGNISISGGGSAYSQEQLDDTNRRHAWEHGQIDYLGIDSFELIQAKLQETISKKPENEAKEVAEEAVAAASAEKPKSGPAK